jgi:hypothetical protein
MSEPCYEVKVLDASASFPGASFVVVNAHNANEPIFYTTVEAEAKIVAFALNAVADGDRLGTIHEFNIINYYDGPTEGVGPPAYTGI